MLTLQQATDSLREAGVHGPRMLRSYKRKGYREVLIEGAVPTSKASAKVRLAEIETVLAPILESLQLVLPLNRSWSYDPSRPHASIAITCKVQLPEQF